MVSEASKSPKNTNPTFNASKIIANNSALTSNPQTDTTMYADVNSSSYESYPEMDEDGVITYKSQEILVSWFATKGSFNFSRTVNAGSTVYSPNTSSTKPLVIVAVLRDGRTGVAVEIFRL